MVVVAGEMGRVGALGASESRKWGPNKDGPQIGQRPVL